MGSSSSPAAGGHQQGDRNRRGWGRLDDGLLPLVTPRLKNHIGPARLVCRQWAAELPQGCTNLSVSGKGPIDWEHRFCALENLTWESPEYEYTGLYSLPRLRNLALESCRNEDLRMLRGCCPGVADLSLHTSSGITHEGLKELTHMSSLRCISLFRCGKIADEGLKELSSLCNLDRLALTGCEDITDVGLAELRQMSALSSLCLSSCKWITDEGLKELTHISTLTKLHLNDCEQITGFKEMPSLVHLTAVHCPKVTDDGLKDLEKMPSLTYLDLIRCRITDQGMHHIKNIPSLTSLYLECDEYSYGADDDGISDEGLQQLKQMSSLTRLSLGSCSDITQDGLMELPSSLTSLRLEECYIEDDYLEGLKHLTAPHLPRPDGVLSRHWRGAREPRVHVQAHLPQHVTM